MTNQTITLSSRDYYRAYLADDYFILRQDSSEDLEFDRREKIRNRPIVGKLIEVANDAPYFPRYIFRVKDIQTVAICLSENHPLWVDGEPVKHIEQELFAQKAGYETWEQFADEMYGRYGTEFNGYLIEI